MPDAPIALTPGEPAGIGPDLVVALAAEHRPVPWIAVADCGMLERRAAMLRTPLQVHPWSTGDAVHCDAGHVSVLEVPLATGVRPGEPDSANAPSLLEALRIACAACIDGTTMALVTGPVQKSAINNAGIAFSGHTEFLAGLTGGTPVMMLAVPGLRVALATTHLPLRAVADAIDRDGLERTIRVVDADLRTRFHISRPRIAVLGLNPHAGEGGHLGREEIDIITPVLDKLRDEGIALDGPLPADTAFRKSKLDECDVVLAMYHDQGLPVLKYAGFGDAVNITLGLPIVRTSVDHGTALPLAGSGRADPGSLRAAIAAAARLAGSVA